MNLSNLFENLPAESATEVFEEILRLPGLRIERIVSAGQATPPGEWFDQDSDEWVALLAGSAGVQFEKESDVRILKPGDYLHIPAHSRHRVEWTDAHQKTIWLALHFRNDADPTEVRI